MGRHSPVAHLGLIGHLRGRPRPPGAWLRLAATTPPARRLGRRARAEVVALGRDEAAHLAVVALGRNQGTRRRERGRRARAEVVALGRDEAKRTPESNTRTPPCVNAQGQSGETPGSSPTATGIEDRVQSL